NLPPSGSGRRRDRLACGAPAKPTFPSTRQMRATESAESRPRRILWSPRDGTDSAFRPSMSANRHIRYAVVGAGNIAQMAVLPAFAHAKDNSQLVALVSGDAEKRRQLGKRHGLELEGDYSELESIIERGCIDA